MPRVTYVKSARQRRTPTGEIKPLLTCDKCSAGIGVGTSYKRMAIKTGPYSSRTLVRCDECPTWQVWEYSHSTSARLAQIVHTAREATNGAEDPDTVRLALGEAGDAIREIAEEKRDNAQNIVDGFGHETSQSEELINLAEELEQWADDIEQADIPELPDPDAVDCEECHGEGTVLDDHDKTVTCGECGGTGHPAEITEEQADDWRDDVDNATVVLDESPV